MRTSIAILVFTAFLIPQALAAEPPLPPPPATEALVAHPNLSPAPQNAPARPVPPKYDRDAIVAFASSTAASYGLNPEHFVNVIEHESHFSNNGGQPSPTGDYGYCQINYASWHKDISMKQMLDPYWCIPWMAAQWKAGNAHWWTEWRILYG